MSHPSRVCQKCKGSGSNLTLDGFKRCPICQGTGNTHYRSIKACVRRQAYLQGTQKFKELKEEGYATL